MTQHIEFLSPSSLSTTNEDQHHTFDEIVIVAGSTAALNGDGEMEVPNFHPVEGACGGDIRIRAMIELIKQNPQILFLMTGGFQEKHRNLDGTTIWTSRAFEMALKAYQLGVPESSMVLTPPVSPNSGNTIGNIKDVESLLLDNQHLVKDISRIGVLTNKWHRDRFMLMLEYLQFCSELEVMNKLEFVDADEVFAQIGEVEAQYIRLFNSHSRMLRRHAYERKGIVDLSEGRYMTTGGPGAVPTEQMVRVFEILEQSGVERTVENILAVLNSRPDLLQ